MLSFVHPAGETGKPLPLSRLSTNYPQPTTCTSLPFVFTFAKPLQDREAGPLGVGNRERLQLGWRMECGDDLAHGLFAGRALSQRRGAQRPAQREGAAAHLAFA